MNTISPLQIAPRLADTAQQQRSAQQPLNIQVGQILRAEVLETRGNNQVLMKLGDNMFMARTETTLRPGQTLQLQLTSTSPELQLKIVGDTVNQFLGRSLTLIGNTIDISTLFSALKQPASLFESLSLNSRQALDAFFTLQNSNLTSGGGHILKQLVDRLGMSFEHLLARGNTARAQSSLKSALLELILTLKGAEQARDSAGKLLATLEFFQLAQLATDTQQQFLFPLPFSFIEQGYLLVERRNEDDGSQDGYQEQEYRFSLHVTMLELGNIRVDFFHGHEGLFIRFHAESEEKAQFIAQFSDQLKIALTERPLLGLSFASDAQDPAAELARLILPQGGSVLDTTA